MHVQPPKPATHACHPCLPPMPAAHLRGLPPPRVHRHRAVGPAVECAGVMRRVPLETGGEGAVGLLLLCCTRRALGRTALAPLATGASAAEARPQETGVAAAPALTLRPVQMAPAGSYVRKGLRILPCHRGSDQVTLDVRHVGRSLSRFPATYTKAEACAATLVPEALRRWLNRWQLGRRPPCYPAQDQQHAAERGHRLEAASEAHLLPRRARSHTQVRMLYFGLYLVYDSVCLFGRGRDGREPTAPPRGRGIGNIP
jgi:hypothetical protein